MNAEVLTTLIAEISRTIKEFVEASFQVPDDDSGSELLFGALDPIRNW